MVNEELVFNNFFKDKTNMLKKEEYTWRKTSSGNILIYNLFQPNKNWLISKSNYRVIGTDIENEVFGGTASKIKNTFVDYLENAYPEFKPDDYNVMKSCGTTIITNQADCEKQIVIRTSSGEIIKWTVDLPYPVFSTDMIPAVKDRAKSFLSAKETFIVGFNVKINRLGDTLTIEAKTLTGCGLKGLKKEYKRKYLTSYQEVKGISIRPTEFVDMTDKLKNKISRELKRLYREEMRAFGGANQYRKFIDGPVGQKMFRKAHTGWLYTGEMPEISEMHFQQYISSGQLQIKFKQQVIVYDIAKDKITKGLEDIHNVNRYLKIFEKRNIFSRVLKIIDKDWPDAELRIRENNLIWVVYLGTERIENTNDLNENYEKEIRKRSKELKEILKKKVEKEISEYKNNGLLGNLLAMAIVELVKLNRTHIATTVIVQLLRGMAVQNSGYHHYLRTSDCGKFNDISAEEIKSLIWGLIQNDILGERRVEGKYDSYYIIVPGPDAEQYMEYCEDAGCVRKRKFTDMSENAVLYALSTDEASKKSDETIGENFIYLSDHPAIYCYAPDKVMEYAQLAGKKYKDYVMTMAGFEDVPARKRYKTKLSKIK